MDRWPLIVVVALMTLFTLGPSLKAVAAKLIPRGVSLPSLPSSIAPTGSSDISRDQAVAGLMLAVDFAHQEGRHDLCDGLGALLPGLIAHSKEPAKA